MRLVRVAGAALWSLLVATFIFAWVASPIVTAAGLYPLAPSVDLAQPAPTCVELLVNGGFEQTAVGWNSVAGASLFAYATDQYVSGRHSLLLGFTSPLNITATFGVEQLLTLPVESTSIEFAFSYAVQTESGADAGDQAYLTIHDAVTNQLLAMLVLSPTDDAWSMGRYDLTPLAGKNIRLTFSTLNDGEPGRLAMRVDDVSILACLPPESFALAALPTPQPTPVPPTPELLLLTPVAPPTVSPEVTPVTTPEMATQITPSSPQSGEVFPRASLIDSLEACRCDSSLYACSSFSNWSVAQACYTYCQVTTGYDIHNLDEDRNGIACELELQDIAPLDATPSPQPTPSSSSDAAISDAAVAAPNTDAMSVTNGSSLDASPAVSETANSAVTSSVTVAEGISQTRAMSVAIAAAPPTATGPVAQQPNTASSATSTATAVDASSLSPVAMLSLLLFSPMGYLTLAILVVVGILSLWIAYMLGQRGRKAKASPANVPATRKPETEEFKLPSPSEASLPKT